MRALSLTENTGSLFLFLMYLCTVYFVLPSGSVVQ